MRQRSRLAFWQTHRTQVTANVAQALFLAMKATEAQPECTAYWNTLGTTYYRAGVFKTAVAVVHRSITAGDGETVSDHVFLAMAHAEFQAIRRKRKSCGVTRSNQNPNPSLLRPAGSASSTLNTLK